MVKSPRKSPRDHKANKTGFSSDDTLSDGSSRSKQMREGDDPNPTSAKKPRQNILSKNLNRIPCQRPRQPMAKLCSFWNRKGCIRLTSETAKGWLKKTAHQ